MERLHFEHYQELKARGVPILFALWHGRMYLSIQAHRGEGIATMASQSKDGEWIAQWLEANGYVVVRGSTTRGGSQALRGMVRLVRSGRHAALTVDGPKGPPRVVQPGVVQLARLTGAWILPITSSALRGALPRLLGPLPRAVPFLEGRRRLWRALPDLSGCLRGSRSLADRVCAGCRDRAGRRRRRIPPSFSFC